MMHDPVCLMELDPRQADSMTVYHGCSYYFCSTGCREKFIANPSLFLNKAPGMRLTVGVMGSASREQPEQINMLAYAVGKAIAKMDFVLITGACPGLPYECAQGARDHGGLSVGISPGLSLDEHVHKYMSPSDAFDIIIYTGSGLMGREVTNIRSSDMVVILGGNSGTLGEFAIAYDEGKLIGVLRGSGGITNELPALEQAFTKNTGAQVVYEQDPIRLIDVLLKHYREGHFRQPSCFCDEAISAKG